MNDQIRIGDAEREEAQGRLAEHYAQGRLDHDEYTQRLDQIWGARTRAEIDPVFRDLPGPAGAASQPYSRPEWRRPTSTERRRGPRFPVPLMVLLVVLGAIAVVTHLPLILVGLGVWFFFLRGSCGARMHPRRW